MHKVHSQAARLSEETKNLFLIFLQHLCSCKCPLLWPYLYKRKINEKMLTTNWDRLSKKKLVELFAVNTVQPLTNRFTLPTMSAESFKQPFVSGVMRQWMEHNGVLPDLFSKGVLFSFLCEQQPDFTLSAFAVFQLSTNCQW